MHDAGQRFARGQVFLPDMMVSAEAMRAAMAVLDPEMRTLALALREAKSSGLESLPGVTCPQFAHETNL